MALTIIELLILVNFLVKVFVGWVTQVVAQKMEYEHFRITGRKPFQAAFSEKVCIDEARLYMGEWAAAFGRQEAIHSGFFMGVKPTNKKIQIRYMDFWKVENGKIIDNWVMVDFPHVLMHTRV